MTFARVSILIMVLTLSYAGASVSALAQAPDATRENLQQRVEQLESQMEAMRVELTKLRTELSAGNSVGTGERATNPDSASTKASPSAAPTGAERPQTTAAEKRLPGIDLGPVRAVPYGTIYFNAFRNSGGTNNADDPLFATPTNQGNTSMSVRQTRLGLKLEGPTILHAVLSRFQFAQP